MLNVLLIFRNFQMMLSSLLRQPRYVERLKRIWTSSAQGSVVQVPSVTRLQTIIEEAWRQGFDPQVCFHSYPFSF